MSVKVKTAWHCYLCEDCGQLISQDCVGNHSADHTLKKVTMTDGWD